MSESVGRQATTDHFYTSLPGRRVYGGLEKEGENKREDEKKGNKKKKGGEEHERGA